MGGDRMRSRVRIVSIVLSTLAVAAIGLALCGADAAVESGRAWLHPHAAFGLQASADAHPELSATSPFLRDEPSRKSSHHKIRGSRRSSEPNHSVVAPTLTPTPLQAKAVAPRARQSQVDREIFPFELSPRAPPFTSAS